MLVALAIPATPSAQGDPRHLLPPDRPGFGGSVSCAEPAAGPLRLPELVDLALCRNPATKGAYAAARSAAADAGEQRASLLPSVGGTVSAGAQQYVPLGSGGTTVSIPNGLGGTTPIVVGAAAASTTLSGTLGLSIQYLLFDFGGRRARIDAADDQTASALASFSDEAQALALQVVQDYNAYHGSRAAEEAALASVRFAETSLASAQAKERIGTGLPSDTLQARSALAQAQLTLQQARGNALTARGQLAVALTLPPQTVLDIAPPEPLADTRTITDRVDALIAAAERARPDLAARHATLRAAQAQYRAARSDYLPSVSLSATPQVSGLHGGGEASNFTGSVGVTLTVPLFSGYGRTYAVTAARSEVDRNADLVEQTREQVGLDIWTNYQTLQTGLQQLTTSRELLASATAAADLAQGRFKAGVGTFTDLLNAQSSLANGRQQLVSAEFNVRNAQAQLARAVGDLDGIRNGKGPQ
jgi:outer membrane protein TolC